MISHTVPKILHHSHFFVNNECYPIKRVNRLSIYGLTCLLALTNEMAQNSRMLHVYKLLHTYITVFLYMKRRSQNDCYNLSSKFHQFNIFFSSNYSQTQHKIGTSVYLHCCTKQLPIPTFDCQRPFLNKQSYDKATISKYFV